MLSRAAASLLMLSLLTPGCDTSTTPESVAGTYTLVSVDGESLPVEVFGDEILSGFVILRADGTYTGSGTTRFEDFETGELVTETEEGTGTYTLIDPTIRFTPSSDDGEPFNAILDDDAITIDVGLFVAVYER